MPSSKESVSKEILNSRRGQVVTPEICSLGRFGEHIVLNKTFRANGVEVAQVRRFSIQPEVSGETNGKVHVRK